MELFIWPSGAALGRVPSSSTDAKSRQSRLSPEHLEGELVEDTKPLAQKDA